MVLVVDRGEHDDRDGAPFAQLANQRDAVGIGQRELHDRRGGHAEGRRIEGVLG